MAENSRRVLWSEAAAADLIEFGEKKCHSFDSLVKNSRFINLELQ